MDEPESTTSRLVQEFTRWHERAPRVLLVGNVANNAFLIGHYLRRVGWEADVLCADYYHSMGCPEWEYSLFDSSEIDELAPDWSRSGAPHYTRPTWFIQAPYSVAVDMLNAWNTGDAAAPGLWDMVRNPVPNLHKWQPPLPTPQVHEPFADETAPQRVFRLLKTPGQAPMRVRRRLAHYANASVSRFRRVNTRVNMLANLMDSYDAVEAFGSEVAIAGLTGRPFIAFEHGTLRWALEGTTSVQRMTLRGYRAASGVLISNGDSVATARSQRLPRVMPTIHPLVQPRPEVEAPARDMAKDILLRARVNLGPVLLCPLRHDWKVKGTDLYIRALPELKQRFHGKITVLFTSWGAEIPSSLALIASLGVEDIVRWIPPQGRQVLIQLMRESLAVLDQTALPHFGSTAPQALMCGVPVLSSYVPSSTSDICGTPAPILSVFTPRDVVNRVIMLTDHDTRQQVIEQGLAWSRDWHSMARLVSDQENALAPLIRGGHHRRP
ncbi:MAG: hypothetical protein F2840_10840 [Actinobacteria bacterium]|uniref:Unannotated protein n=1 Tax=freshwater metagenome TaxID=449393 RepID=A0A6J7KYD8_9ZZZZ|nr:hypothetical protein [Actinomycetota bacterium]